jgi:hypothetical protein
MDRLSLRWRGTRFEERNGSLYVDDVNTSAMIEDESLGYPFEDIARKHGYTLEIGEGGLWFLPNNRQRSANRGRSENPVVSTYDLRAGDTISMPDLGRVHVIEGPYRSGRGIRFVDQYGNGVMLSPNEQVNVVARENPARRRSTKTKSTQSRQSSRGSPASSSSVPVEDLMTRDYIVLGNDVWQVVDMSTYLSGRRTETIELLLRNPDNKERVVTLPFGRRVDLASDTSAFHQEPSPRTSYGPVYGSRSPAERSPFGTLFPAGRRYPKH